ncbi:hypothetical protein S40285_01047 [Stachybotrys chlorohalonatus IBT 40285]|uniref:Uncharacterized protein n=1 Tax=Stachybotrys chlorohalonatus (strain IBT 40285) TaxID=1283841 RepID=A0A084QKF3_STAC4|nr:hypothetical protein S40285_01047 [Stachybotrys chlorohalonata IBT 40285]
MCTYLRTVFVCHHEVWGKRLIVCAVGEAYNRGTLSQDCQLRRPHGLQTRKLICKCDRCTEVDEALTTAKAKIQEFREAVAMKRPEKAAQSILETCDGFGKDCNVVVIRAWMEKA